MTKRLSWTTKTSRALAHETEAEALAFIAARLPGRGAEPFNTRDGWIIYDAAGRRMVTDR
jgi:hypothetical protein